MDLDPSKWILHVDMDAFYASVEAEDDPSLKGRPVIVGGTGPRGVVASCSYEARAFGVRSAMPSGQARRLCPHAVFLDGRHGRYAEVSRQIHAVFQRFTPLVEGISLDEAFLDITGSQRLFGTPGRIGAQIRQQILDELGLSCCVGGATVKFLSKLASVAAKPRADESGRREGPGIFIVEPGQELAFLHPHPIEALWGVGPATAKRLRALGLATIGDLAGIDPTVIENAVGRAAGRHLANLARGIDDREVEPDREVKSISHEETYATDRRDLDGLRVEVIRMADSVATRMRRAGVSGRTVTLKYRFGDFSTRTRSLTVTPTAEGAEIARIGHELLAGVDLSGGIRLLGVGMSNLIGGGRPEPDEQLTLDLVGAVGPGPLRPAAVAGATTQAVDAIRARYGPGAVGSAALLGADGLRVKRPGDTQWGPSADQEVSPSR
ncbi:MAG TPA: DNA polymerase IV [Acidimicrobiales bacterium]|nr:DNA polymerase IV [Acidimicrobiales bacterium]